MKNLNLAKYYIEGYLFQLPAYLIHELSHWIVAFFFWIFSINGFPVIRIKRWFHAKRHKPESNEIKDTYTESFHMCVEYSSSDVLLARILITVAPAVTFIAIMFLVPWWLKILAVSQISTFWLSNSDSEDLSKDFQRLFKIKKPTECLEKKSI